MHYFIAWFYLLVYYLWVPPSLSPSLFPTGTATEWTWRSMRARRRSERLRWESHVHGGGARARARVQLRSSWPGGVARVAESLVARRSRSRCGGAHPVDLLARRSRLHRGFSRRRTQQSPRTARRAADQRWSSRPQSPRVGGVLDAVMWWNESMLSMRVSFYFQRLGNNADTFHRDETFPFSLLLVSCNLLMWHLI